MAESVVKVSTLEELSKFESLIRNGDEDEVKDAEYEFTMNSVEDSENFG